MPSYRKKLIEVALPLDAINKESAREKSIRHGHPSTLHLWWARRPLAACRAVLFSQLVDDPSEYMPDEKSADEERERLFKIIEDLVLWENINNEEVLDKARLEIARSVARDLGEPVPVGKEAIREFLATKAPPVLDPFAGGGSIPLEAQRLGLRAYASDLNPVAVLINKALIEIPPKFAGMPPVHPREETTNEHEYSRIKGGRQGELWKKEWKGAEGLAEDVRYYGKWMRGEAEKRIGHLYPKYKITAELLAERPDLKAQGLKPGDELTVIAWLWARTVKCPNPACGKRMPMLRSFWLARNKAKSIFVDPITDETKDVKFIIRHSGSPQEGTTNRNEARCLYCNNMIRKADLRHAALKNGMREIPYIIVCDTPKGRDYFPFPSTDIPTVNRPYISSLDFPITNDRRWFSPPLYGLNNFIDLYTSRQLITLNTFSELLVEIKEKITGDMNNIPSSEKEISFDNDKKISYTIGIILYLGLAISRLADILNSLCMWENTRTQVRHLFTRQAMPILWDFAEANTFSHSAGDFEITLGSILNVIEKLPASGYDNRVIQHDATESLTYIAKNPLYSTDPPYYDNIGYADLSDFFYVWLRHSLGSIIPGLFGTTLVPKAKELVASTYRFNGDKRKADKYFENGLKLTFQNLRQNSNANIPTTIFYAFKQAEATDEIGESIGRSKGKQLRGDRVSTGWETMLYGLLSRNFQITGTWPLRSEMSNRPVASGTNALASSIVLVCRPLSVTAPSITRRDFLATLKRELPTALRQLQLGYIAPVDFAQAAIGPGMAIFSRNTQVLEADGSPMSVRTALALINQALDEFLAEKEGEYDTDTRWALAWYEQYGFNDGPYGVAETLSKAKNTSVGGLEEAGVLVARAGKVRLLSRTELKEDWDPSQDKRPTAWEAVQYLIRALDTHGEQGAALLLSRLGGLGETARDLAYRLYTICERKGWAQDALGYNMLVVAWPRLKEMARSTRPPEQGRLI